MRDGKSRNNGKKRTEIFRNDDQPKQKQKMIVSFEDMKKTNIKKRTELLEIHLWFEDECGLAGRKNMILFLAECFNKKDIHLAGIFLEEHALVNNNRSKGVTAKL